MQQQDTEASARMAAAAAITMRREGMSVMLETPAPLAIKKIRKGGGFFRMAAAPGVLGNQNIESAFSTIRLGFGSCSFSM